MKTLGLLLLTLAASANAAVTGTLIDEQAKPVSGATIRAYRAEERRVSATRFANGTFERPVIATAKSGENGAFSIDVGVPLADLVIDSEGLQQQTVEVPDGQNLNIIVMRPKRTRRVR